MTAFLSLLLTIFAILPSTAQASASEPAWETVRTENQIYLRRSFTAPLTFAVGTQPNLNIKFPKEQADEQLALLSRIRGIGLLGLMSRMEYHLAKKALAELDGKVSFIHLTSADDPAQVFFDIEQVGFSSGAALAISRVIFDHLNSTRTESSFWRDALGIDEPTIW